MYNNGGYVLLAEIVKRVSGQSLRAFADARIFRPLGMRQSHLHDDVAEVVPKLATGYTRGGDGALRVARQTGGLVGNGGLFTTVGDLLRWERNFAEPRVGAALVASMETPPALPGGETTVYGLGLQMERHRRPAHRRARRRRSRRQRLRGALPGRRSRRRGPLQSRRDRLHRAGPRRRGPLSRRHRPGGRGRRRAAAAPMSSADLAVNEGLYRDPTDESLLRIFLRDGTLRGSPGAGADGGWPIVPLGANRFRIPTTTITLEFDAGASGAERCASSARPTPAVLEHVASYAVGLPRTWLA